MAPDDNGVGLGERVHNGRCALGGVAIRTRVAVSALFSVRVIVEVGVLAAKVYGGDQDFGSQELGLGMIRVRVFRS